MADPTTSRLNYQLIQPGDNVSVYTGVQNANASIADAAVTVTRGLLASRPAASTYGRIYVATDDLTGGPSGTWYWDNGTSWEYLNKGARGAVNISASQSTSSTTYAQLATPDQVSVYLPTNGMIQVYYHAIWQESVVGAGAVGVFLGSNQVQIATTAYSSPQPVQKSYTGAAGPGVAFTVFTTPIGLGITTNTSPYSGDVTTGQVIGGAPSAFPVGTNAEGGGPISIWAAAGRYTVSVQWKASSGSVTASNRHLWVEAKAFV